MAQIGQVILAVRIKGDRTIPEQPKRILKSMRLHKIHSADVYQVTAKVQRALKVLAPYIIFGTVSKSVLSQILRKRGFAIVDKKHEPISNEQIIEDHLGHLDIVCIEDLGKILFVLILLERINYG